MRNILYVIVIIITMSTIGTAVNGYNIRDLGTLGGSYSHANHINDIGQIVGSSETILSGSYMYHATVWDSGEIKDLGTLTGHTYSNANSINNKGQIVGSTDINAVIWENDIIKSLGGVDSSISDINNKGQIAGTNTYNNRQHAALWINGKIIDLGTLPGGDFISMTSAINDRGDIAGFSSISAGCNPSCDEPRHAVLWQDGNIIDLGVLSGRISSHVNDINNRGDIVGNSYTISEEGWPWTVQMATLWNKGKIIDLGVLPGKTNSVALGINNKGQIVGYSYSINNNWWYQPRATLWDNGKIIDLGILTGGTFSIAIGINNKGQIVGYGDNGQSETHAILWS